MHPLSWFQSSALSCSDCLEPMLRKAAEDEGWARDALHSHATTGPAIFLYHTSLHSALLPQPTPYATQCGGLTELPIGSRCSHAPPPALRALRIVSQILHTASSQALHHLQTGYHTSVIADHPLLHPLFPAALNTRNSQPMQTFVSRLLHSVRSALRPPAILLPT